VKQEVFQHQQADHPAAAVDHRQRIDAQPAHCQPGVGQRCGEFHRRHRRHVLDQVAAAQAVRALEGLAQRALVQIDQIVFAHVEKAVDLSQRGRQILVRDRLRRHVLALLLCGRWRALRVMPTRDQVVHHHHRNHDGQRVRGGRQHARCEGRTLRGGHRHGQRHRTGGWVDAARPRGQPDRGGQRHRHHPWTGRQPVAAGETYRRAEHQPADDRPGLGQRAVRQREQDDGGRAERRQQPLFVLRQRQHEQHAFEQQQAGEAGNRAAPAFGARQRRGVRYEVAAQQVDQAGHRGLGQSASLTLRPTMVRRMPA
jgi:hypothetical protein